MSAQQTVLVVDDEEPLRRYMGRVIEDEDTTFSWQRTASRPLRSSRKSATRFTWWLPTSPCRS
jgi:DNA-binding NtrC family response regulator